MTLAVNYKPSSLDKSGYVPKTEYENCGILLPQFG